MLSKVFKNEVKMLAKPAVSLCVIAAFLGVIAGFAQIIAYSYFDPYDRVFLLMNTLSAVSGICIVGAFIAFAFGLFFILYRFYRSVFTDEGYLTMVLPVSGDELLLGKMFAGALFSLILLFGYVVSSFFSSALPMIVSYGEDLLTSLRDFFFDSYTGQSVASSVLYSVYNCVSVVMNFTLVYTALTLGCTVMKRAKMFGGILFLFLTVTAEVVVSVVSMLLLSDLDPAGIFIPILSTLLSLGVTAGAYFFTRFLFTKKFNIE